MNDFRNEAKSLWVRQLSGEELNDAESQLLSDALRGDSKLQRELSADATSHALLQSLEDVVQTENEFVQAVLRSERRRDSRPAEATQVPEESSGLPLLADSRRSKTLREKRRQRTRQRMPLLLTLMLFLAVGLVFWFQGNEQPEIAGTRPSPEQNGVGQNPATERKYDNPAPLDDRNVAATDAVPAVDGPAPDESDNVRPQLAVNDIPPAPGDNLVNPEPPNMTEEPAPTITSQSFATLTKLQNPVWERKDAVGARLGDEVVRLFGGTVELTFDDGAVVTLEAPVEFQPLASGLLNLRRGKLSATVPKPAIGFTVFTPTSEVVDLGTEFDIAVKDNGASDVVIRTGEVEVAPGGRMGKDIQKWKLVPRGLNRASFYAKPNNGKPGPIVAKVQGARGQFQGIISMDGKTANFHSEDTFNNVHQRVITQLKNSQDGIGGQWQEFVDSMQSKMRGTMNFNGQQIQFGNLDEVMRLHNQLRNQFDINAGIPFNGSININGKVIQFETREEFEAARRAAFGPAANFGAGEIFDKQRGPG